ncbi:hypothetical protein MM26B8_01340 [Mycoplasmopsis meleagridis]|nr:hypothetical protein MM26B8_01340 [Mycoplasmopsis meleagridis]
MKKGILEKQIFLYQEEIFISDLENKNALNYIFHFRVFLYYNT